MAQVQPGVGSQKKDGHGSDQGTGGFPARAPNSGRADDRTEGIGDAGTRRFGESVGDQSQPDVALPSLDVPSLDRHLRTSHAINYPQIPMVQQAMRRFI